MFRFATLSSSATRPRPWATCAGLVVTVARSTCNPYLHIQITRTSPAREQCTLQVNKRPPTPPRGGGRKHEGRKQPEKAEAAAELPFGAHAPSCPAKRSGPAMATDSAPRWIYSDSLLNGRVECQIRRDFVSRTRLDACARSALLSEHKARLLKVKSVLSFGSPERVKCRLVRRRTH